MTTNPLRYEIAYALWHHQAARAGTKGTAQRRTPDAFWDQSDETRNLWLGYADVALAILDAHPEQPAPDVAPMNNTALAEALSKLPDRIITLLQEYSIMSQDGGHVSALIDPERDSIIAVIRSAALASYEAKPAPDAVAEGWQPIETAPHGASGKPETYLMLSKQGQGTTLVCTGYVNPHGAFEWFGGGMRGLTHWMPLPAPPALASQKETQG